MRQDRELEGRVEEKQTDREGERERWGREKKLR